MLISYLNNKVTDTALASQAITATGSPTGRTLADRAADRVSAKDFGAVGNGTTNDTTAIQAFFDYITVNGVNGYIPRGAYKLTAAISIGQGTLTGVGTSYWSVTGERGTILRQHTVNIPILSFDKEGNQEFEIDRLRFDYNTQALSSETSANCIWFTTTTANNYGHYNFVIRNCTFGKGYGGIVSDRLNANTVPVWGGIFENLHFNSTLIGPAMDLRQTTSGQPNNVLRKHYLRRDNAVETAYFFAGHNNLRITDIEFNSFVHGREIQFETCEASLDNIRFEVATITTASRGFITYSAGNYKVGRVYVQNITLNHAIYSFIHRVISGARVTRDPVTLVSPLVLQGGALMAFDQVDDTSRLIKTGLDINGPNASRFFPNDNTRRQTSHSVSSIFDLSMLDDTAVTLPLDQHQRQGLVFVGVVGVAQYSGVARYDSEATTYCVIVSGGADFEVSTAALAGTTGTDVKVTVSANANALRVENRSGATRTIRVHVL